MKHLAIFLLSVLALTSFVESKGFFKFEDCSKKGKNAAEVELFQISPDPIELSGNVTLSVRAKLHRPIPPHAVAKRTMTKKVLLGFPLTLPCLFNVGSCTTKLCDYVESYREQICHFFPRGGDQDGDHDEDHDEGHDPECGCPMPQGDYVGYNITVPIPDLGSFMKFLAQGEYTMKVVVLDGREELICFKFQAKVKS